MYKKINYIIYALVILLNTQCQKDPGLIRTNDQYSSSNYPENISQLSDVLTAAYTFFRFDFNGQVVQTKMTYNLDHTADVDYGGDLSWLEAARLNMSSNNAYADQAWTALYKGIKASNAFLDREAFYKENKMKAGEEEAINHMEGEARFMRALNYFYLIRFYGEAYIRNGQGGDKMGVPIITSLATSLEETQATRSSVREVYDYIIADLLTAEELLAGYTYPADQRGRANEWAVKALLGKVYVNTEEFDKAKPKLLEVINQSGKQLMPFEKYKDAFNGNAANEFNEESLFEINVDRDFEYPTNNNLNTSTVFGLVIAPSYLGDDGTEETAKSLGFSNEHFHDKNLARFGFNLPLWTLVPNPSFNSSKPPSALNPKLTLDPNYRSQSVQLRTDKITDPRLYVCALQPWIDSVSDNGGVTFKPVARYKEIPLAIRNQYYGWSLRKFAPLENTTNNYKRNDAANQYVLRLADVYLLYAEAAIRTGDNITGLEYINKGKRRAYSYPVNTSSPVDYLSLSAQTKASDPVLKNDPLKYERFVELFGEFNWWFDICRWQIGPQEGAYYAKTEAGGPINFDPAKSYVLPIPTSETNTNTKITQNPNY